MMDREKMVWYAVYGSNLLYERFMCYLKGGSFRGGHAAERCSDSAPPRARLLYELPYDMYFGKSSGSWEGRVFPGYFKAWKSTQCGLSYNFGTV